MATSRRERWRSAKFRDRVATASLGTLLGITAGAWAMIALYVAEARWGNYVYALEEIAHPRPEMLVVLLGVGAGMLLGYHGWRSLGHGAFNAALGLAAGAIAGGILGPLAWAAPEGHWAGGIIGSAIAMSGGIAWVILRPPREPRVSRIITHARIRRAVIGTGLVVVLILLIEWSDPPLPELPDTEPIALPDPATVDAAVFLLGDGGATTRHRTPLLRVLGADIEHWSRALARDSAVSLLLPGDVVYPSGVRDRDHPGFPQDSIRLFNQIRLVSGPAATQYATVGLFLAGNHDWGNATGQAGLERLRNLEDLLEGARAAGPKVALLPPAGSPGPVVRDLRRNVRIVFLDTHWFLQEHSDRARNAFFDRVEEALRTAGERHVIMVAHHPYRSAGPHGALFPGTRAAGLEFLLKASGTLVQDLNSPVYSAFRARLDDVFIRTGEPPLIFVGGHDHSLQVMAAEHDYEPVHSLISGAGSKVSRITRAPGLRYGAAQPGYMLLTFRRDDAVDLFVYAGDADYLTCSDPDPVKARQCMGRGTASFEIVYSATLLYPPEDIRRQTQPDSGGAPRPATPWVTLKPE